MNSQLSPIPPAIFSEAFVLSLLHNVRMAGVRRAERPLLSIKASADVLVTQAGFEQHKAIARTFGAFNSSHCAHCIHTLNAMDHRLEMHRKSNILTARGSDPRAGAGDGHHTMNDCRISFLGWMSHLCLRLCLGFQAHEFLSCKQQHLTREPNRAAIQYEKIVYFLEV